MRKTKVLRFLFLLLAMPSVAFAFPVDFDGDGKVDLTVYRPVHGMWYMLPSSGSCPAGWTVIVTGQCQKQWGLPGDKPMVGDFDQDGKADLVVYRPSNQHFYIHYSSHSGSVAFQFPDGTGGVFPSSSDKPDIADVNGDGRSDVIVYKQNLAPAVSAHARVYTTSPPAITHYSRVVHTFQSHYMLAPMHYSVTADYMVNYGIPNGDYWGEEVAFAFRLEGGGIIYYRYMDVMINHASWFVSLPSLPNIHHQVPQRGSFVAPYGSDAASFNTLTGEWRYRQYNTNFNIAVSWGLPGDVAVPGDYTGNGVTDLAVWRPSDGTWYMKTSTCPSYAAPTGYGGCFRQWGLSSDLPVHR